MAKIIRPLNDSSRRYLVAHTMGWAVDWSRGGVMSKARHVAGWVRQLEGAGFEAGRDFAVEEF